MLRLQRTGYWAAMGFILGMAGFGIPSYGDLVLEAPSVSAAPGSSGSFDLLIEDTDAAGSPAYHVAGISSELAISGSGVTFTGVTTGTATPNVFAGHSFSDDYGSPLSYSSFPTNDFIYGDVDDLPYQAVSPGDVFGILHVSYSVDAGAAAGPLDLTIEGVTDGTTDVSDEVGNAVPFTVQNGVFTVAVPEPAAGLLALLGLPLLARRRPHIDRA
jgi:hypothetical protein